MRAADLILVIERDPLRAFPLESELRSAGYVVASSRDGATALALAGALQPDLILLGLDATGLDGWEFMRRRATEPRLCRTPVVLTASSPADDRPLPPGIDAILFLPASREALLTRVAVSLRRGPREPATRH